MDNWATNHYKEIAVAERYDAIRFNSLSGKIFNRLERGAIRAAFTEIPKDTLVLDVPSGTGRLAEELLESGYKVYGVDISEAMLEVARRKLTRFGDRFQTAAADVRELAKTKHEKYDATLCARVLMHFPLDEQITFLKSVVSLTRGRVVFTQSYSSPYQRFRRKIKKLLGHQVPSVYPITEEDLQKLLQESGLLEIRRHRIVPFISELIVVVAEPIK